MLRKKGQVYAATFSGAGAGGVSATCGLPVPLRMPRRAGRIEPWYRVHARDRLPGSGF